MSIFSASKNTFTHNIQIKMIRQLIFTLFLVLIFSWDIHAQTERAIGLRENTPAVFAFTNADIVTGPGRVIRGGEVIVRNGTIEAAGSGLDIPSDASVIDLDGRMVYPGFIDIMSHYGMPEPEEEEGLHYWNPQVRAHYRSAEFFRPDEEQAADLRSQGFVVVNTASCNGLFRGTGSIVSLGDGDAARMIIRQDIVQHMGFRPSEKLGKGYPASGMGAIALIRQSLLDAGWYVAAHSAFDANPALDRPETNKTLDAIAGARKSMTPFIVEVENENWFLRAAAIAGEFDLNMWIVGSGHEYRRLEAIAQTGMPVILPLAFPEAPDVTTPEKSINVSLETLRHWYLAPENPSRLADSGLMVALSSYGSEGNFLKNLQAAVERGLDKDKALAALTTIPAKMLGIDNRYGAIAEGNAASFIIADDDIFDGPSGIREVWVDGKRYVIKAEQEKPCGTWQISSGTDLDGAELDLQGASGKISLEDQGTRLTWVKANEQRVNIGFVGDSIGLEGFYNLSANLSADELLGLGKKATGDFFTWMARRTGQAGTADDRPQRPYSRLELPRRYPSMEYGLASPPEQPAHVIIRNATIWTQGPAGILENADMLIEQGQITAVGHNIAAPRRSLEIDASGMHVTPGLIDPHIHTSITGGVNETGDAITAETRITDVLHGDNVWIYRLLAGGITSATLFHGSANPIGGQNAVIKMRWGQLPGQLTIEDAAPGLKMALGENVKRLASRYPGSRQGTEQIIRDAFQAALEYNDAWSRWEKQSKGMPPRRDLQLEAILEVIKGERKAHVHAYRQDEMLMMMRLAEEFGFTVGSFEHTLEGYKIADELREHGAGAVVWTDWSSFKVEAYDGILYNARLLNEAGVLTSLHSDNTQLSTRMNWEGAKTMMTGVSETDAMNFITLHPAKIMGIDHRVGSLEAGKDADFVIWNGHPMSTFSIPEQTWVDGKKYFDRKEDRVLQTAVKKERALIINRIHEEAQ